MKYALYFGTIGICCLVGITCFEPMELGEVKDFVPNAIFGIAVGMVIGPVVARFENKEPPHLTVIAGGIVGGILCFASCVACYDYFFGFVTQSPLMKLLVSLASLSTAIGFVFLYGCFTVPTEKE